MLGLADYTNWFQSNGYHSFEDLLGLPFAFDDPPKQTSHNTSLDISDLITDLYNDGKTANLRKGSLKPWFSSLVAANFDNRSDE